MYKVGKHCWASQKCGCQLAQYVWTDISEDIDYVFFQGRNPYHRIVSLYAGHFIDINGIMWWNRGYPNTIDMPAEQRGREIANRDPGLIFKFRGNSVIDYTFDKFVLEVLNRDLSTNGDAHVRLQVIGKPQRKFDDVLLLEDLPEAYYIPLDKLGRENNLDYSNLKKDKGVVTPSKHITPKRTDLNDLDSGKVLPSQWWEYGVIPSNYSTFYQSKEVRSKIEEIYREDFEFYYDYGIEFKP